MTTHPGGIRLFAAAEVRLGRQRSPETAAGPHMARYLRAANVGEGGLALGDVKRMNFELAEQRVMALRPGDVLISEGSGSLGAVGSSATWSGEIPGIVCFQNTLIRLRARPQVCDPGFLAWWAQFARKAGIFASISAGAGIYHLGVERLKSLKITLPSLDRQRELAGYLDGEVSRINRIEKLISEELMLLAERRRAVIDEEVNLVGSRSVKLFHLLAVLRDGSHQPPPRVAAGVPLLTARNVSSGQLRLTPSDTFVSDDDAADLERSLKIRKGDLLISVKGTIGATALVPEGFPRAVLDRNLALLRTSSEASTEWIRWLFQSSFVRDQVALSVTAAAQPGLSLGALRSLRFPGIDRAVQERQVARIEKHSRRITEAEDVLRMQRRLLDERRHSLIAAAVTGQLDVTTARGVDV